MRITLIGAGNLATNLGHALRKAGHEIVQIYSRTMESAQTLAQALEVSDFTNSIDQIHSDAELYIVSIKDAALSGIATELTKGKEDRLFVHTAGSMPMDTFTCPRRGVFYPMQTFSKQRIVDFSHIPLFIEASQEEDLQLLHSLAETITNSVYEMSSEDRKYLHVAAVFCCNFANHCSALSAKILEKHNIPFSVMLPLIDETTRKIHTIPPKDAQTGPAMRYDENVMNRHIAILQEEGEERMADIYKMLSESIHQLSINSQNEIFGAPSQKS